MEAPGGMMDTVDEDNSREPMRAADVDRDRVAEQLRSAHAEGRLDLAEYDERVRQVWAARTYGELEVLTADLPQAAVMTPHGSSQVGHRHGGHWVHRRGSVAAWLSVSVINLVIWGIVSLVASDPIHPWWIWVAGPWGAVLLAGWITERVSGVQRSC